MLSGHEELKKVVEGNAMRKVKNRTIQAQGWKYGWELIYHI